MKKRKKMVATQLNSNEVLLESYKELKGKIEKKENLELIARGFFIFSFLIIPLFIGLIMISIVAKQNNYINNRIKNIIEVMVKDMGYIKINDFFNFFPPMDVYSALNDLFKDRLSEYKLSKDKLMIIYKEEK